MRNRVKKTFFTNKYAESILIEIARIIPSFSKLFPSNTHYSKGTFRNVIRDGLKFNLDLSDYQEYLVYFNLKNDSSKPLLKYIPKEKGVILDIGANIGQTTLWMAQLLNDNNKIISFEPYPRTFLKLKKNLELNSYSNIILENIALGNTDSTINMVEECETNSGGFRVYNPKAHGVRSKVTQVEQITLDQYFSNINEKITFIKIDVEGFEYNVLRGAKSIIKKHQPILYIELSNSNLKAQGSSASQVIELLHHYGIRNITNVKTNSQLEEHELDTFDSDIVCNW